MAVTVHKIVDVYSDGKKSYEFCGLSTDLWPREVDGKEIEVNSLFLELDTGNFYYYDGGGSWNAVGGGGNDDGGAEY